MTLQQYSRETRHVWFVIAVISGIALLFVPFSQNVLGVTYNYTLRTVALGGATLGIVSGVLGCFAVLRHESLMGDALSHAALPGVALAFLFVGRDLGVLLLGAGIASWLGVLFIQQLISTTRIKQDTAMGIVLASWFAAGIALLAYIQGLPDASQAGLDSFIFGQAAAIVESDVQLIVIVGALAFAIVALFWKEFKLITFDIEFASANGLRTGWLNALLSTLIVVAIVLGLQLAGVILMVGMLIAPAIAARQWTHRLDQMVLLAAVMGAFAGSTGAIISAIDANIPTGPMIIVVAFSLTIISLAIAPQRGLLWVALRRRRDRRRFAAQTTLRDMYKYASAHGGPTAPVPINILTGVDTAAGRLGLRELSTRGYVQQHNSAWALTEAGVDAAQADLLNQQLWDAYRAYSDELALPLIPEDRLQNIHDVLPDQAIARLRYKLEGSVA